MLLPESPCLSNSSLVLVTIILPSTTKQSFTCSFQLILIIRSLNSRTHAFYQLLQSFSEKSEITLHLSLSRTQNPNHFPDTEQVHDKFRSRLQQVKLARWWIVTQLHNQIPPSMLHQQNRSEGKAKISLQKKKNQILPKGSFRFITSAF